MLNNSPLLYQTQSIKELEQIAIAEYGISIDVLMQRDGAAAFSALREAWPNANNIIVICGKGNNAGDGYVVAKCAAEAGLQVAVLHLAAPSELQGAAYNAAMACRDCGIAMQQFSIAALNNIKADVIVDALLGTGLQGAMRQDYSEAVAAINSLHVPVIAIDIPSGLNADTGWTDNDNAVVKAKMTITFIGLKNGLFTGKAAEFRGRIVCDDLDLPTEIFMRVNAHAALLGLVNCLAHLPKRVRYAHKGDFGHVLIVGGDYGMGGAVRMAAEAAARSGAGLVSVATRTEHVAAVNAARPEIMCHGVTKAKELLTLLKKATCVVVGPGLGQSAWSKMLWQEVMKCGDDLPLVVDADALNLLAKFITKSKHKWKKNQVRTNWVLTPHPGEAARLLNISTLAVQNDRYNAVAKLQHNFGGVVILKGSGSLVKSADNLISVCPYGNPGMASGGMGDVLSGIIGGLLAQGLAAERATQLALCVHAKAADEVARESGGERGLLAMDLVPYIKAMIDY